MIQTAIGRAPVPRPVGDRLSDVYGSSVQHILELTEVARQRGWHTQEVSELARDEARTMAAAYDKACLRGPQRAVIIDADVAGAFGFDRPPYSAHIGAYKDKFGGDQRIIRAAWTSPSETGPLHTVIYFNGVPEGSGAARAATTDVTHQHAGLSYMRLIYDQPTGALEQVAELRVDPGEQMLLMAPPQAA